MSAEEVARLDALSKLPRIYPVLDVGEELPGQVSRRLKMKNMRSYRKGGIFYGRPGVLAKLRQS